MKKFTSILCALMVLMSVNAAPFQVEKGSKARTNSKVEKIFELKASQAKPVAKIEKSAKIAKAGAFKAPKAESDFVIISEQPEGTAAQYTRSGSEYYPGDDYIYYQAQSGKIDVVFNSTTNKVYFKDLVSSCETGTWVEGVLKTEGDAMTISVALGQNLYYSSKYDACLALALVSYDEDNGFQKVASATEVVFKVLENGNKVSLQGTNEDLFLGVVWTDDASFAGYGNYETVYTPYVQQPVVTPPTDLQTETYKFSGYDNYWEEDMEWEIQVGFYGTNQVYFQGLSYYVADAWVVGTLDDKTVTIPETYLGVYESLLGDFEMTLQATTMQYDAALDKFTCAAIESIDDVYSDSWDDYSDVVITKLSEFAATPADPSIEVVNLVADEDNDPHVAFEIPLQDVDGNDLMGSKMSYIFYVDKAGEVAPLVLTTALYEELSADMTEIPYNFTDNYDIEAHSVVYLNQGETELRSWNKLGLQSIYRGGNAENKSNIVWYDVKAYWAELDGESGEGGEGDEGLSNTDAAVKAAKRLVNGQLVIEKNGVRFNAIGAQVK